MPELALLRCSGGHLPSGRARRRSGRPGSSTATGCARRLLVAGSGHSRTAFRSIRCGSPKVRPSFGADLGSFRAGVPSVLIMASPAGQVVGGGCVPVQGAGEGARCGICCPAPSETQVAFRRNRAGLQADAARVRHLRSRGPRRRFFHHRPVPAAWQIGAAHGLQKLVGRWFVDHVVGVVVTVDAYRLLAKALFLVDAPGSLRRSSMRDSDQSCWRQIPRRLKPNIRSGRLLWNPRRRLVWNSVPWWKVV